MPSRNRRRGSPLIHPYLLIPVFTLFAMILFPVCSRAGETPRAADPEAYWDSHVAPLLDKYCLKCHAGVRQQGGLDLRSLDTILRGGEQGPAMIPGKPNESRMVQYVSPNSTPHMPLDAKRQLSPEEITALKTWIALLPAPKSKLASGTSSNTTWVPEYLAEYRRSRQTHEIPPANLSADAAIDWF